MLNNLQFGIAHLIELPAIGSLVPFLQSCIILAHRLEVEAQYHDAKHKEDGKESVEIKRYRLAEKCQSVLSARYEARYSSCPTRDRGDDADRSGCRIDEISQLLLGNTIAHSDRTHHRTHGKAVEVIIDEYQNAEQNGSNLYANLRVYVFGSPTAESCRTTRLVHQ